jgi:hypothetical protein
MQEYALIMRHEDGAAKASPEQMQQWMTQTMDCIESIAAQNKFVSGTGLPFEDAIVVDYKKMVTNGPFGALKETIGGLIVVRANSYNILLSRVYSPIAALNRTYAISKVKGVEEAVRKAKKLALEDNPFYFTLLGEVYRTI